MKHTEPIPPELAAACSKCGAQPMLTGNDGEQSFRCHCSGCARKLIVPHWTTEGAIDAWNDAQKDDPHFEVIRIQSHNGYTLPAGKFAPPAEFYPSSEQWGTAGWTYNDLPTAEARFNALGDSLRLQRF